MSKFSVQGFMDNLPAPILMDDHLRELAEVAARVMIKGWQNSREAAIYCRIDELDESVLDILAVDLKVDWYDYDANLETKRRMIYDSWRVHKRMGSVAAVENALSDVWPNSTVEEWFEYGGEPFHFRVILDVSETPEPVLIDGALNMVRFFKPARAHLQDDIPIVRVVFGIEIQTSKDGTKYHVEACGTIPRIATHGQAENDSLVVGASASFASYEARPCGTSLNALM